MNQPQFPNASSSAVPVRLRIVTAVAVVVGMGVLMKFSYRDVDMRHGGLLIKNAVEYERANQHSMDTALSLVQKIDGGKKLEEADKAQLRSAISDFESMITFEPRQIGANFAAGRCYEILGDVQKAYEKYSQAVLNGTCDPEAKQDVNVQTIIDCQHRLAELLLGKAVSEPDPQEQKRVRIEAAQWAEGASKSNPKNPIYGCTYAIALEGIGRREAALAELARCEKLVEKGEPSGESALKRARLIIIKSN